MYMYSVGVCKEIYPVLSVLGQMTILYAQRAAV